MSQTPESTDAATKHRPFFYGWVIVAVALLMNVAASPASAVTFGFFIKPMSNDLGWSSSVLTLGLTFRLAVAGITSPLLGMLLDRLGPRILGSVAAVTGGLSIVAIGAVHQVWLFFLLFAISGLSGFGGPSGQLLTVVPVAKWFQKKRGRALALASMGMPFGNLLLIPLAQFIIDAFGWRTAWVVLGTMFACIAAPLCALFMRKDPESLGLRVDGEDAPDTAPQSPGERPTLVADEEWTVRQALRAHVFWVALMATALAGIVTQGTLVNRVPFWQDVGIGSGYVAIGTAMAPMLVVMSGLTFGFLADRIAVRYIGIIGGLGAGLSVVPMIFARNNLVLLFSHNVLWGFGQGANNTVNNVLWPNYFGRRNLGAIRGLIFPIAVGTAAISAPLFAVMLAAATEPRLVWVVTLVAFTASGLLYLSTRPPGAPPAEAETPVPAEAAPLG